MLWTWWTVVRDGADGRGGRFSGSRGRLVRRRASLRARLVDGLGPAESRLRQAGGRVHAPRLTMTRGRPNCPQLGVVVHGFGPFVHREGRLNRFRPRGATALI